MGWMNFLVERLSKIENRTEEQENIYNALKASHPKLVEKYDLPVRKAKKEKDLEQRNKTAGNFADLLGKNRLG